MRTILVLAALALFASGCSSSSNSAQAGARDPRREAAAGPTISTVWGALPSYKQPAVPRFKQLSIPWAPGDPTEMSAVVDVLLDGDGTVLDAAIYRSSGNKDFDLAFLAAYRTAVFPPMPAEYQSFHYVSRQTMKAENSGRFHAQYLPPGDSKSH